MSFLRRRLSLLFLMLGVLGVFSSFEEWQRERDDRAFDARGQKAMTLPETHLPDTVQVNSVVSLSYVDAHDNVQTTDKALHLNQERLNTLRAGGRLEIVVLPDQPKKARFPDWERPLMPLWTAPLMGVLGLVGFYVLAIRPRRR